MRPILLAAAALSFANPALADQQRADGASGARSAAEAKLAAIAQLDDAPAGPQLNAVIAYDPQAPDEAARQAGQGPLGGRTVLVKDNIETRGFATTAAVWR